MKQEQMTLKGSVEVVQDLQTFDSGFTKQVLVVNTGGEYPQQIPVEFVKDNTAKIANLQVGDNVEVGINIRGNEYNGKYYANIQGWKVDLITSQQPEQSQPNGAGQPETEEKDSIPF
jgi:hypothetical protein